MNIAELKKELDKYPAHYIVWIEDSRGTAELKKVNYQKQITSKDPDELGKVYPEGISLEWGF